MSAIDQGDLTAAAATLGEWLRNRIPEARGLRLADLRRPGGAGYSNDTLLGNLDYRLDGEAVHRPLVFRVSPSGFPVFPFYDIPRQFDIMRALEANTDVPVPHCLWKELDRDVLGEQFYVMDFIDGDVPADNPPFTVEGFVHDATPKQRSRLWHSGVERLARIAAVQPARDGLDFLLWPDDGRSPIAHHLEYYEHYYRWAAEGRENPVGEAALEWLRANMPADEPVGLIWGDARPTNQISQNFEVVAVIDWEMAATGNPEADLGWWLFLDRFTLETGNGQPQYAGVARLEGQPTPEQIVAQWEAQTGRTARHLHYYQVFAGFRFVPVMLRMMQQVTELGMLPAEFLPQLERNNGVTQLLADLLGLPAPQ